MGGFDISMASWYVFKNNESIISQKKKNNYISAQNDALEKYYAIKRTTTI